MRNEKPATIFSLKLITCVLLIFGLSYLFIYPVRGEFNLTLKWEFSPSDYFENRTFSPTRMFPPTVFDIDGDEGLELLWATARGDSRRIWCISDKGMLEWVYPPIDEEGLPGDVPSMATKISIIDLEDDGIYELALAGRDRVLRVLTREGKLLWEWPEQLRGFLYGAPQAMDVDGDGFVEFFLTDAHANVYRVDHTGHLVWSYKKGDYAGHVEGQVTLADIDRDTIFEILYLDFEGLNCLDSRDGSTEWIFKKDGFHHTNEVIVADLDEDGEYEALVWNYIGSIYCVSYYGAEKWRWDTTGDMFGRITYCHAMGDIDEDGRLDLVFTEYDHVCCVDVGGKEPRTKWILNVTQLVSQGILPEYARVHRYPAYTLLVDLDGDGSLEILLLLPFPVVLRADGVVLAFYKPDEDFPGFKPESGAWWGDIDQDGESEWICDLEQWYDEAKLSCLTAHGSHPAKAAWPEYYHSALPPEYQRDQGLSLISAYSNSLWFPLNEQTRNHIGILLLLFSFSLWYNKLSGAEPGL